MSRSVLAGKVKGKIAVWKIPPLFGMELDALVVAVGGVVTGIIGAVSAGVAVYLKAYKGSYKQQYDLAKIQIKEGQRQVLELRADRDFWKSESEGLRVKLAERDATIRDRDRTIALRDRAIEEQARTNRQLSADVADLAAAFLVRKGDAKGREVTT